MPTLPEKVELVELHGRLRALLPDTSLEVMRPPLVREIGLYLLADLQPDKSLDPAVVSALMEEPPYWSLCWASGQVLARYLLDHPRVVSGRTVVDLGAGSGIVAIAAAMAGAATVIACDLDPWAHRAVRLNAGENGVQVRLSDRLEDVLPRADLVCAADILYDRDNLPLLERLRTAPGVLLADSRIPDLNPPGYRRFGEMTATTWPDLDESREFNRVRLFAAGGPFPEPTGGSPVQRAT